MSDSDDDTRRRDRILLGAVGVVGLVLVVLVMLSLRSPPQMGTSEQVFNTVDALYTAVRNDDLKRIDECQVRLRGYRKAGKLPPDAADKLDRIIATAKSGAHQSAAESLYAFMLGQRREGVLENDRPPAKLKK